MGAGSGAARAMSRLPIRLRGLPRGAGSSGSRKQKALARPNQSMSTDVYTYPLRCHPRTQKAATDKQSGAHLGLALGVLVRIGVAGPRIGGGLALQKQPRDLAALAPSSTTCARIHGRGATSSKSWSSVLGRTTNSQTRPIDSMLDRRT